MIFLILLFHPHWLPMEQPLSQWKKTQKVTIYSGLSALEANSALTSKTQRTVDDLCVMTMIPSAAWASQQILSSYSYGGIPSPPEVTSHPSRGPPNQPSLVNDRFFAPNRGPGLRGDPTTFYTYRELKALIKEAELSGRGIGFEAHHLLEKRYARLLGVSKDDIISAAVTPQWHRNVGRMGDNLDAMITTRLKQMGTTPSNATVEEVWQAHKYVSMRTGNDEWAEAIYRAYFKKHGVKF